MTVGPCGALGCVLSGWLGQRFGPARTAVAALSVSGSCCILATLTFESHPLVVVPLLCLWGAAVVADSAMFSSTLTVLVDECLVGTALAPQAAGFLITVVTIQAVPLVVDAAGWAAAPAFLCIGPVLGVLAMRPLVKQRRAPHVLADHICH